MQESKKELLKKIDTAIEKILIGGQSYRIGTKQMNRANLDSLYKLKKDLENSEDEYCDSSLLGGVSVAFWDRR